MPDQFAHCTFCGARFTPGQPWPRRCAACGKVSYLNPKPVAVALQPLGDGLLVIRRADSGRLALPGGYIEVGETWQAAAARELSEETGMPDISPDVALFDAVSAPDGTLLIVGLFPLSESTPDLSNGDGEALGWEIITAPAELGFDIHTAVVRRYFENRARRGFWRRLH